jgi:hypothetical protein
MPEGELIAISKIPEISAAIGRINCFSFTFLLPHHPVKIINSLTAFHPLATIQRKIQMYFHRNTRRDSNTSGAKRRPCFAKLRFRTRSDSSGFRIQSAARPRGSCRIGKWDNSHFVFLVMWILLR